MKKKRKRDRQEEKTTTTTGTPRRTDLDARGARTGRNGCGNRTEPNAYDGYCLPWRWREPVTFGTAVRGSQRSFGGALGEPPERSAAPPVPAHRRRRSSSSCETGYDGQTSGYQRVDDDDVNLAAVVVAASVEETDGRTHAAAAVVQCSHYIASVAAGG